MSPASRPIRAEAAPRHGAAYIGLLLFTVCLYVRPNDLLPIGTFPLVRIVALGTFALFFTERVAAGGSLSVMPRSFMYLLGMGGLMVLSIPFGLDPGNSLVGFADVFLKVMLVFLLIINVVTSFRRLRITIEILVLAGGFVAVTTLMDFSAGRNLVEGFRAAGAVGGILGNPNDLALAMNVLIPLGVSLVCIHANPFRRALYVGCVGAFATTVVVTFSRSGLMTFVVMSVFMVIQMGRRYPWAWGVGAVVGIAVVMASPGTFWNRISTIFEGSGEAGISAAESATARWELVKRSIEVAGANPIRWLFGVGIDNFHVVGLREQVNHNAYLQVFNEVGLPALIFYVLFLVSVVRITASVAKRYVRARGYRQVWLVAIGLEGSLIGFMVGSFFASVAFLWYVYYPAAFAVCLQQLVAQQAGAERKEEVATRVWYLRRVQH